jgi:hypothetical protein
MAEARHVMRVRSSRTTRPEAVTAPHRRPVPKATLWPPMLVSSGSYRRSKAPRDALIARLFIATARPDAIKPRRDRHQSP